MFVANEDSNSIYVLDKNTLNPIGIIGVDNMPH
ncbi:YncE family protein, partial [Clostridioides difficile]